LAFRPRRLAALLSAAAALACGPPASAQPDASPAATAPAIAADCSIAGPDDAARILGYPVEDADEVSRAGGICFFASRAVSDDGAVSYAIVTASGLPARRAFFAFQARLCAGVTPGAPNDAMCRTYVKLSTATDLDAYFAARTATADASPVPLTGADAVATATAVFVRTKDAVIEAAVRRSDVLDVDRSLALAKLLLERLQR
jgi:hypothetical protein